MDGRRRNWLRGRVLVVKSIFQLGDNISELNNSAIHFGKNDLVFYL